MKVGDLVKYVEHSALHDKFNHVGLVLEIDVSMWGDEFVPSGVHVLWTKTGNSEIVYEDEVVVISEAAVDRGKRIN